MEKSLKYKLERIDIKTDKVIFTSEVDELEVLRKYYSYHKTILKGNPIKCIAHTENYSDEEHIGTITTLTITFKDIISDLPDIKEIYTLIKK